MKIRLLEPMCSETTLLATTTPLLVPMHSNTTPLAFGIPLLATVRFIPTPPAPTILPLAKPPSTTTQWPWGIRPPKVLPHITTKEAHISGIRQDTPQARVLTTTPSSGIRQDTALPPAKITSGLALRRRVPLLLISPLVLKTFSSVATYLFRLRQLAAN